MGMYLNLQAVCDEQCRLQGNASSHEFEKLMMEVGTVALAPRNR